MITDVMETTFEVVDLFGKMVLFTDERIAFYAVPVEGLYIYTIRHGDDAGIPVTIEKNVIVNFFGTILSKEPIEISNGYRPIPYDDFSFTGVEMSVFGYMSLGVYDF